MDIKIRKLERAIVERINELAEKKGVSREEYLRGQLRTMAVLSEVKECENRYSRLVELVCQSIQDTHEILAEVLQKLEAVSKEKDRENNE